MSSSKNVLYWNGTTKQGFFKVEGMEKTKPITVKPNLGFSFFTLAYEPELGSAYYSTDEITTLVGLSEEQKNKCDVFVQNLAATTVVMAAYDPRRENLFVGNMYKSLVEQKQLVGMYHPVPDHPVSKFNPTTEQWDKIYAVIRLDGHFVLLPDSITSDDRVFLTQSEWEEIDPGTSNVVWDFDEHDWVDSRDLEATRTSVIDSITDNCEILRQEAYERSVSLYELASWPIKLAEAKSWLKDRSAPTPYFDSFNSRRDTKTDKETFMRDVLENNRRFTELTAIVDAYQWNMFEKVRSAATLEELDQLINTVIVSRDDVLKSLVSVV